MSDRTPLQRVFEDAAPPTSLRERVLNSTRASRPGRRRVVWGVGLAAALLLGFVAGRVSGRAVSPEETGEPQYLLLLYEGAGYRDDRPTEETVAEYRRWADSLRSQGLLARADKLDDERLVLHRLEGQTIDRMSAADPTGLFIVRAESRERAMTIAATSPHLRYGGRVIVRRML